MGLLSSHLLTFSGDIEITPSDRQMPLASFPSRISLDGLGGILSFRPRNDFDPSAENVICAANDALWRSTDRGVTWNLVFPGPDKGTVEFMRGDHADHGRATDDPACPGETRDLRISAVAVDPRDSEAVEDIVTPLSKQPQRHVRKVMLVQGYLVHRGVL
ncbi:MAG: hypothetical protein ACYTAN_14120 [Planctomycetota bacterium]